MIYHNYEPTESIDESVNNLLEVARVVLHKSKMSQELHDDFEWAIGDVEEWIQSLKEQSGEYFDRYIAGDR